ncbi:Phosphoheptose isomerase [Thermodesulfobacterium geofontis OPF15]|jgi:D-sedoheptulose 7-phosphate isomerase|uniref:Phosphoheptose isomerase n=1 Tax=Thermodesulfobacterium geofontis (strain OPF15) TaxID=795359 RepID=F8C5E7_THEGP|nr:D-sedoheptulose 7-phosphate isomerase [Thermodesulfobacterium geofontis]AEH22920.1 Phosphoheptose isomerase [Thermodesulfobacterium geofontis OPF15]
MKKIDLKKKIFNILETSREVQKKFIELETEKIIEVVLLAKKVISRNGKILIFGNGGSAADAQHLAAELVNRFKKERAPLPAIALTTDTSILTAIANDYDFSQIFSKQILALGKKGDMALGISTSGKSSNVISALKVAKEIGLYTVGLSGGDGGLMKDVCDYLILVPSFETPRIQEGHLLFLHIFSELLEEIIFSQ